MNSELIISESLGNVRGRRFVIRLGKINIKQTECINYKSPSVFL